MNGTKGQSTSGIYMRNYLVELLPPQPTKYSKGQINPLVLQAIDDNSQPLPSVSIRKRIVKLYSKLGIILRPDNPVLLAWQIIILAIISYYFVEGGFVMAFGQAFWQYQLQQLIPLNIVFLVILVLDILISPIKGFYDQGLLIRQVRLIVRKYLKNQFWIDILGLISIIIPIATGNIYTNYIKLLWLLKIYTALLIDLQFQRMTRIHIYMNTCYLVFRLFIIFYWFSHFSGLGFFMVSNYAYTTNYYGPNTPMICWTYNTEAIYQLQLLLPWSQQYAWTMYYSIGVVNTIAYGDITPKNALQTQYTIGVLTIVAILYGYLLTQILRILLYLYRYYQTRRVSNQQFLMKLQQKMVPNKLVGSLKGQLQQLQKQQRNRNRFKEDRLLAFLPNDALYFLLLSIYESFLIKIGLHLQPIMQMKQSQSLSKIQMKSQFLLFFIREIKQKRFFVGDIVYHQGELQTTNPYSHCAYYYARNTSKGAVITGVGRTPIYKDKTIDSNQLKSFILGVRQQYFGDVQFLTGKPRSHWAFCKQNCVLFMASRNSLLQHYEKMTTDQKEFLFEKTQHVEESQCLVCDQKHFFKKCPAIFLQTNAIQDIQQRQTKALLKTSRNIKKGKLSGLQQKSSKSLHVYQLLSTIKDVAVNLTHDYKRRLFNERINIDLFVQQQLNLQDWDQMNNLGQEMQQLNVIIQRMQDKQLQKVGLSLQQWTSDQSKQYKYYKPKDNVSSIIRTFNERKSKQ